MTKRIDNRVPVGTLPIGTEVLIRGNKQYKYVTGNTRVLKKEDNNG